MKADAIKLFFLSAITSAQSADAAVRDAVAILCHFSTCFSIFTHISSSYS